MKTLVQIKAEAERLETIRYVLLTVAAECGDIGLGEEVALAAARDLYGDAAGDEVCKEMDYLASRRVVTLRDLPALGKRIYINRNGRDFLSGHVAPEPGIYHPGAK